MGCVIHSWNLMIFILVIGGVAMVYSTDDMDVQSMAEDHPEVRDVHADNLQLFEHLRSERTKGNERSTDVEFEICLNVGPPHRGSGTDGEIWVQVQYDSGNLWPTYEFLQKNIYADDYLCFNRENKYFGNNDGVAKIWIYNTSPNDGFYPRNIRVFGPVPNYRYNCNWSTQCSTDSGVFQSSCRIYEGPSVGILCNHY